MTQRTRSDLQQLQDLCREIDGHMSLIETHLEFVHEHAYTPRSNRGYDAGSRRTPGTVYLDDVGSRRARRVWRRLLGKGWDYDDRRRRKAPGLAHIARQLADLSERVHAAAGREPEPDDPYVPIHVQRAGCCR